VSTGCISLPRIASYYCRFVIFSEFFQYSLLLYAAVLDRISRFLLISLGGQESSAATRYNRARPPILNRQTFKALPAYKLPTNEVKLINMFTGRKCLKCLTIQYLPPAAPSPVRADILLMQPGTVLIKQIGHHIELGS